MGTEIAIFLKKKSVKCVHFFIDYVSDLFIFKGQKKVLVDLI